MKILVVVDMQRDFISGALGNAETKAVVGNVSRKIGEYAGGDSLVYFTYDTHGENYLNTQEGRKLPVPHCIENTEGWQLEDEIAAARERLKNARDIKKPTFGSAELPEAIRRDSAGEDISIELAGVCTDICVISNAMILKAAFPETEITVDSRCCAGVTPESHERALKSMESCQINVLR